MSGCFLTCRFLKRQGSWSGIPISLRIFRFVVTHTVKGFSVFNEAEVDIFLEFSCFFYDPRMLPIWSLVPLHFLNPAWTFRISLLPSCWGFSFALGCEVSFFSDPPFSCVQLFSGEFLFWSSRRRFVYVLLLHHVYIFDENVQPVYAHFYRL